ncbi:uncharacterized protein LOC144352222, partial [Saccoglossus kowalevskii]
MTTDLCNRRIRELYINIQKLLGDDEVKTIKQLLSDEQMDKREKDRLNEAAEIFERLEEKGLIQADDLSLLRDLLTKIDRKPLIERYIEPCENELAEILRKRKDAAPKKLTASKKEKRNSRQGELSHEGPPVANEKRETPLPPSYKKEDDKVETNKETKQKVGNDEVDLPSNTGTTPEVRQRTRKAKQHENEQSQQMDNITPEVPNRVKEIVIGNKNRLSVVVLVFIFGIGVYMISSSMDSITTSVAESKKEERNEPKLDLHSELIPAAVYAEKTSRSSMDNNETDKVDASKPTKRKS